MTRTTRILLALISMTGFLAVMMTAMGASAAGEAAATAPSAPADPRGAFTLAAVAMTAFAVVTILGFLAALGRSPTWSIGDALSEEAGNQPMLPPGQKPIMVASVSRTIALFGLFVIMTGVFGIAYFI